MKVKSLLDFFGVLLFKFVFIFIDYLPSSFAKKICNLIITIIVSLIPRAKYVMRRNLQLLFPTMNKVERNVIIKKHLKVLSDNIYGFSQSKFLNKNTANDLLDRSEIEEEANKIISNNSGTGYLFLVPHFGSFELLAQLWALNDKPFSILARGFDMPLIDIWWNKRREINGNSIFSRKGGFNEVIKRLSSGQNVAILFDQNVKRSHGVFAPFFGIDASTTKTVGIASLRTGCHIIMTAMIPTEDNKYKLIIKNIKRPQDRAGDNEEQIKETVREANLELEKLVREYPEMWFLMHRRFKTRPLGENENFYDEVLYPVEK